MSTQEKRICHACRRPFDPSSPGATMTMGPTCAKRGVAAVNDPDQLALLDIGGESECAVPAVKTKHRRTARAGAPVRIQDQYVMAKTAFEEIYRLYHKNGSLLYGEDARLREAELIPHDFEAHTLRDPLLPWLEPEQDVCLLIDHEDRVVHLRRTFNDENSFLSVSFDSEGPILALMDTIVGYSRGVAEYRAETEPAQLSLLEL